MTKYDFISAIKSGNTLLIGAGNFTFTISLMKKLQSLPNLITSTYEGYSELSEYGKLLKQAEIKVLHGIDATESCKNFYSNAFDIIIFQFPPSGRREGINEVNANYVLVKKFIISASSILTRDGSILITRVHSNFYNNMFRCDDLAAELGISLPIKYKLSPKYYLEYEHSLLNRLNIPGLLYISSYISSEYAEELLKLIDAKEWNCMMDLTNDNTKKSIYLEPQNLLILTKDARYKWNHGIAARKSDNGLKRQRRILLTFRKVI